MTLRRSRINADGIAMGSNEPVYRTSCIQCGQPALTFDREGHSFCKEHAQEFIPAVREPEPEEEAEDW